LKEEQTIKNKSGNRLDQYLTRITPFGFSGTVLVAEKGNVVLNKGYGLAIREKTIPNTAETVFCTGSITKQFTAAAIMKLEMQGKIGTNDSIKKYFEKVPKHKEAISIHNLLTHTAGLVDNVGDDYEAVSRDEVVQRILNAPLLFAPGDHYEYSNAGYSLLAAIIEFVSGHSYEKILNEQLFTPAEMPFTGYRMPKWDEKVVADWYVGEVNNRNSLKKAFPYWNLIGNGGILSTTEDMHMWLLALKGNKILSAEAKKKLFTPFLENYAYGWNVSQTDHGTLITHGGANDLGASADFRWFLDCDTTIILFCNQSYGKSVLAIKVKDNIAKMVFGGNVAAPPVIAEKALLFNLERLKGTYRLPSGGFLILSKEADTLKLAVKGKDAFRLIFSPEQNADYEDLNRRTSMILEAAAKGDYSLMERELEDKATLDRKQRFIEGLLDKTGRGSAKAFEIIGTLPFPRQENAFETIVELKCEKENVALGLIWRKGKFWGITQEPDYPSMPLKPVSKQTFAGYHLSLAKNVEIRFSIDNDGFADKLTINADYGKVIAVKL
jgi:CubicO group peptidase (beta-lactamase class C family)